MQWYKEIRSKFFLELEIITGLAGLIVFISFYAKSYALFFIGIFLIVYVLANYYYYKHVGKKLVLANPKRISRLFPGDQTNLTIELSQKGRLPILNSQLLLSTDLNISVDWSKQLESQTKRTLFLPVLLFGGDQAHYEIPITALQRGVAKINGIQVKLSHILGFDQLFFNFLPFYQTEIVVYPLPKEVSGLKQLTAKTQGRYPVASSLYEDRLAPLGTRDYISGDSFQRVHWKASAKKQKLQTKVFERTTHYALTFIVNVRPDSSDGIHVTHHLEDILSHVTYLCQFSTSKHIPFEIYINIKSRGDVPFLHIPLGEGKDHLNQSLELLARVRKNSITTPFNRLLHYLNHHGLVSPTIIYFGGGDMVHEQKYFTQWERSRSTVYVVSPDYPELTRRGGRQVV